MFNINDLFYKNIYTSYSNEKGKVVILYDKIVDYYNLSLPKEYDKCDFLNFDLINKKIKCETNIDNDFSIL